MPRGKKDLIRFSLIIRIHDESMTCFLSIIKKNVLRLYRKNMLIIKPEGYSRGM